MGRPARFGAAGAAALACALLGAVAAGADGVSGAYMQSVLADGPVAFYPLDTNGQVMLDDSGHGHNGAYGDAGGTTARLAFMALGPLRPPANRASFGVVAGGATVGVARNGGFLPSGNAPRTVEVWFSATRDTVAGAAYPLVAWGVAGSGREYGVVVRKNTIVLDYYSSGQTFATPTDPFDGSWHQVVVSYDGETTTAYMDGALVGSEKVPSGRIATQGNGTLILGDWVDHIVNSSLAGAESDVSIYATALDSSQVRAHFLAAGGAIGGGGGGPSTIALSLPSPAEAFGSAGIVLATAAVAIAGTVFITFPAQLFNLTLQENYPTIMGWLAPVRRRLVALRNVWHGLAAPRRGAAAGASAVERARPEWPAFAAVIGMGALLGGFLDPGFGFNASSLESYAGIVLSMLAGIVVAASVSDLYHRRGGPVHRHLRALPLGLLLGAVCVVISRVAGFQPGYLYGVVCGVAFERVLTPRESGHVAALSTLSVICASVVAWVLWVPLNTHAAAQGAFPLLVVVDDFLAALLVGGLVGSVIGLLPLRFLPGGTVREWNPRIWFALFGLAMFALVAFVIRSPASSTAHRSGLVLTIVLFVAFAGVSVGFREYFAARWRREHGVTTRGLSARLRELVTPRPPATGPATGDVAVSGGGGGSAVITDEVAAPDPRSS